MPFFIEVIAPSIDVSDTNVFIFADSLKEKQYDCSFDYQISKHFIKKCDNKSSDEYIYESKSIPNGKITLIRSYDKDIGNEVQTYSVIELTIHKRTKKYDFNYAIEDVYYYNNAIYYIIHSTDIAVRESDKDSGESLLYKYNIKNNKIKLVKTNIKNYCIIEDKLLYIHDKMLYTSDIINCNNEKKIIDVNSSLISVYNNYLFVSNSLGIYRIDVTNLEQRLIPNSKKLYVLVALNEETCLTKKSAVWCQGKDKYNEELADSWAFKLSKEKHYLISINGKKSNNIKELKNLEIIKAYCY